MTLYLQLKSAYNNTLYYTSVRALRILSSCANDGRGGETLVDAFKALPACANEKEVEESPVVGFNDGRGGEALVDVFKALPACANEKEIEEAPVGVSLLFL